MPWYLYHGFALYFVRYLPIDRLELDKIPIYPLRVILTSGITVGLPLVVTFAMAAISYKYFETPFLRMKERHSFITRQQVLVAS
jgi:peptidoglycan/LPS O-acetylase OafA/YrhL